MNIADRKKTTLIGLFVLAACILTVWGLIFLNPSLGDAEQRIRVRFANIDKISLGTRVSYAGKPIGEVVDIRSVEDPRLPEDSGPIYSFELVLLVDSSVIIYKTDQFAIHTSGLLGERSIAIVPKRPLRGKPLEKVSSGDILYSAPGLSVEETVSGLSSLANKAESVLDKVNDILETNGDDVTGTIAAIKAAAVHLSNILETADKENLVPTLQGSLEAFSVALNSLESGDFYNNASLAIDNFQEILKAINQPEDLSAIVDNTRLMTKGFADAADHAGEIAENMVTITTDIKNVWPQVSEAIENISSTAQKIAESDGTFGKLLNEDGMYLQLRGIFSKVETLMDDVNHYGLLFHLDRSWQRQRTRRANFLAELSSATQFRDYFREEVSQVNSSLSRVSSVLEKIEDEEGSHELKENRQFSRAFNELLRRVEGLQETLKSYNEKVNNSNEG